MGDKATLLTSQRNVYLFNLSIDLLSMIIFYISTSYMVIWFSKEWNNILLTGARRILIINSQYIVHTDIVLL